MADTARARSTLLTAFAANTSHAITSQNDRDFIVSVLGHYNIVTKSSGGTYEATLDDEVIVISEAAAFSLTLPAAATAGWTGKYLIVKKVSSATYNVTIDPNASETIDGATTLVLNAQYSSATIVCDGSNWHII